MRQEQAITSVPSETFVDASMFTVRCALPLASLIQPADPLVVGVSCVLEHNGGEKSYWALSHPGQQPDFHHPDSFVLEL